MLQAFFQDHFACASRAGILLEVFIACYSRSKERHCLAGFCSSISWQIIPTMSQDKP